MDAVARLILRNLGRIAGGEPSAIPRAFAESADPHPVNIGYKHSHCAGGGGPMFDLTTEWRLAAPRARVWAIIHGVEAWPGWWPHVTAVRPIAPGDADGLGAVHEFVWRTALPYRIVLRMRVVAADPLVRIEGVAAGDLEGRGIWTFEDAPEGTLVRYRWCVRTEKPWMKATARLLYRLFAWNHGKVMEGGRIGIERLLAAD
jgi:hypothetical protein